MDWHGDFINWGSVPAWVAGILTGGSLLLGFYILLRDRRKEEQLQANRFLCWLMVPNTRDSKGKCPCVVMLHNASDTPVLGAQVQLRVRVPSEMRRYYSGDVLKEIISHAPTGDPMIPLFQLPKDPDTGEYVQGPMYTDQKAEVKFSTDFAPQFMEVKVTFKDSSGTAWERELASGHLRKV